ncbi:MAG: hypothetical protein KF874_05830 [Rhizobiaceae bacterium]|nr:hypothetical protein [Rhizobiaceae bacterium]
MRCSGVVPFRNWLATILALVSVSLAHADDMQGLRAGNYTFSDELGGFKILGVTGLGTRANPIVVRQELTSSSPVTMVIRSAAPPLQDSDVGDLGTGALHLRISIVNASGQAWVEFEFELQEILHHASIFSDGLSFDQRRENLDSVHSTLFAKYSRDFEPFDRMRFVEGKVDPEQQVEFEFPLTDFTPRWTFYLVQDPRIPSS